jgi:hypothetical protein
VLDSHDSDPEINVLLGGHCEVSNGDPASLAGFGWSLWLSKSSRGEEVQKVNTKIAKLVVAAAVRKFESGDSSSYWPFGFSAPPVGKSRLKP